MQGKATTFGKYGRAQHSLNHSSGGISVAALCWLGFPQWLRDKISACNARDTSLISGSGWSPGEGNGNPLQDFCLENPMDRGVWWATVHRVAKSPTRLSDFTSRASVSSLEAFQYWCPPTIAAEFAACVPKSLQLCPALCDPMDCNPQDSSIHGILQARLLEWVAMPPSRGTSQPRDRTQVSHIRGRFFTVWPTREAHEHWSG